MTKKQKLELTWIGKDDVTKLEPRILIEDAELSYHVPRRHTDEDLFDNKLIFGDNLLALKALEQEYAGAVKCIFIDPPYNTGSAFEHYDDGVEHSLWLTLVRDRLSILKKLLTEDGSIWITIDENEAHYLKVLCDEIFGRINYVGSFVWQKRKGGGNDSFFMATDHDYLLVYTKNSDKKLHKPWRVAYDGEYLKRYKEVDESGNRFYWDTLARDGLRNPIPVELDCPDGTKLNINSQKSKSTILEGIATGSIRLVKSKNRWTLHHKVMMPEGKVARSILDVGTNKNSSDEMNSLFGKGAGFDYAKPESLIKVVLEMATKKGDLVLDSFAGSGTTGAVAHKMGRRWLMIELGEHCHTHVIPRLKKVIDGEDQGGITESVNWKGGGGFRYYKLAPSLLAKDKWDNWVINKDYDANMLAAAVCKHEGFTYSPSETEWWAHGYSTETDFIYVTTQTLTEEQLIALSEDVGSERTLLVCCSAFKASAAMLNDKLSNLTLKKMPHALLSKCEWGKDDYSLNISKLPVAEHGDDEQEVAPKKKAAKKEADLFGEE